MVSQVQAIVSAVYLHTAVTYHLGVGSDAGGHTCAAIWYALDGVEHEDCCALGNAQWSFSVGFAVGVFSGCVVFLGYFHYLDTILHLSHVTNCVEKGSQTDECAVLVKVVIGQLSGI